jgi:hypothetical protein
MFPFSATDKVAIFDEERNMSISRRLMELEQKQRAFQVHLDQSVEEIIHKHVEGHSVSFKLESNFVYLYGVLSDPDVKFNLQNELDGLIGVRGIQNEIKIRRNTYGKP